MSGRAQAERIPRVEVKNAREFERAFVRPRWPAIIVGHTSAWRSRSWSARSLVELLGDKEVVASSSARGATFSVNPRSGLPEYRMVRLPFRRFIARIQRPASTRRYYVQASVIGQGQPFSDLPELRPHLDFPRLFPLSRLVAAKLWVGGGGNRTGLHYDPPENVLVQLKGRKRVTLFDPRDTPALYHCPLDPARSFNCSLVDVSRPDLARFPRFASARPFVVTLRAGEILYIPGYWWHHVESVGFNLATNFWWLSGHERRSAEHIEGAVPGAT